MTNPIGDIEKANVILITGSNTTENHPVLSSYVKRAVTQKGAKLIVVDPAANPHRGLRSGVVEAETGYGCGMDQRHDACHHQREALR